MLEDNDVGVGEVSERRPLPPSDSDDTEQSRRFIDMARELEADESPGATDRAFERVTGQRLPPGGAHRKSLNRRSKTNVSK